MGLSSAPTSPLRSITSNLNDINIAKDSKSPGMNSPKALEEPFAGMEFREEGDTLIISSSVKNPLSEVDATNPAKDMDMGDLGEVMNASFESLRIATSLTTPFEVLEHNATRVEGNTLWWEYDLKSMNKLTQEQLERGIYVRLRKRVGA